MADEIQNTGIQFEDIVPWVDDHGDTGLSARLKLKRNFDKIKAWMDANHIDVDAVKEIIEEYGVELFLSKLNDDTAAGFITMLKGLQIGANFVPDILGEGGVLRMREDGKVELVTDILYARVKAYFDSVEIREYQHTGGNRIASVAGNKICRVAWFNTSNVELEQTQANLASVAYFRCYFRASDGEDTVRNNWVVGDQAYCHITSVTTSSDNPEEKGLNQKHLWRLVIGRNTESTLTEDGEAYIDLSNRTTETISGTSYTGYQSGSDIPTAQDDIIQLGNVNDTTRQGAIVEFVTGTDAPSYQIYQGINSFSLNGKNQIGFGYNTGTGRAYLNVYGDFRFGSRPNTQGSYIAYNQQTGNLDIKANVTFTNTREMSQFVKDNQNNYDDSEVKADIATLDATTQDLQKQIDGAIETWFMTGVPTLQNAPANEWTTDDEKDKHIGDLYYDKTTGHGYRFMYDDEEEVYLWTILTDEDVTEALRLAAQAQETADGKRTVYSVWGAWMKNNVNTLEVGDLFIPNTDTEQGTKTYKAKKVYKCTTDGSATFSEINYTDDTRVNGFINELLNGQTDTEAAMTAAIKAIRAAVNDGKTTISGGLVLTNEIAMRDTAATPKVWSGISGMYDANVLGGGIASWWGGARVDHEVSPSVTDYAKSLVRFDGSGYFASGNITWDAQGRVAIKDITTLIGNNNTNVLNELTTFNNAFHFNTQQGTTTVLSIVPQAGFTSLNITENGVLKPVATQEWVNNHYVSISFFERLFNAYNGNTKVSPNSTATIDNIKAMFGFWTEQYISAIGKGEDSGGGGVGDVTWDLLASTATGGRYIDSSYITAALTPYATQSWVNGRGYATQSWVTEQGYATQAALNALEYMNGITGGNGFITFGTNKGNSTVVDFTHEHSFLELLDRPDTIAGYGITLTADDIPMLTKSKISDFPATWVWSAITGKPNSIAGYGILDAKIENGVITLGGNSITPLISETYRGTVVSVGLSVPAGFSVSGTPITDSGTLAIDFASGYEGFTTDLKNKINALFSWFEVDANGNIKTKDYTENNETKHRGFYSPSFISALGMGDDGQAGQGDVTWALLASSSDTRQIALSHLTTALGTYATQQWVNDNFNKYTLPTATSTVLGGIKVGSTLAIASGVLNLPTTGVTAGTYKRVTVDAYGRVTSGDNTDIDTNTWRNIYVGGSSKVGTGIDTKAINFKAGSNVAISYVAAGTGSGQSGSANYFDVVISATDTTYSAATQSVAGLMSADDKKKLDGIAEGANKYSLPTASSSTLGGVKVGSTLAISSGVLNQKSGIATAGTYRSVTVDTYGRVTAGTNPTTLAGYGITDAKIVDGVITLGAVNITPITSVAMTVPSGFSISGSPISKAGTLALSYESGYEGFTTELKNKINSLFSWFEVDSSGNVKTKDYTENGTTKHRGFYSPSFVSALGQGDDGQSGVGDVTWELLAASATGGRTIHLSYISSALASYLTSNSYVQSSAISDMATKTWVGQQGYLTSSALANYYTKSEVYTKTEINAMPRVKAIAWSENGITFTWQDNSTTIADFSHEHSFLELLDRPSTIAGYGISLTADDIPNLPWDKITSGKPTTISGYGITDAVTSVKIGTNSYAPASGIVTLPAYPTNYYSNTDSHTANTVLAAPSGSSGVATFRSLVAADIPTLTKSKISDFPTSWAWSALTGVPTTIAGYGITDAHISNGVITLGANTITPVTSVAMTVPTGFSVSGSPISKAGTLALSYESGYEGFTTELKNKLNSLFSWFEVDSSGNVKTKDYTENGTIKHRGFYSPSFVSALGQGDDGQSGVGDVTWDLLAASATGGRTIHLSYISSALASYLTSNSYIQSSAISDMATKTWVGQQDYLKQASLSNYYTKSEVYTKIEVNALARVKAISASNDGLTFTWQDNSTTIADFSHEHSFLELLDRPDTIAGYGITLTADDIPMLTKSKISDFPATWAWSAITGKPNSIAGYGILDAKIENGVITLGGNSITPLISETYRGTVVSVGLSVPAGFSVSGTPITDSGTLAIDFASGYEGFTTDLKNKINALFSWFEVDANGNIKTKDYTENNETRHRGFYSPSFISALGQGDDGTTSYTTLAQLNDVSLANPTANQILKYDGTHWVNAAAPTTYVLPTATDNTLGGIKVGYTTSGKNYKVQVDVNGNAFVNVPWTDTTYDLSGYATKDWVEGKGYATTTQLNALEFLSAVTGGDGVVTLTTNKNNSTTLDLSHEHSFLELLDRPTTIAGYGITDAVKSIMVGTTSYTSTDGIITLPTYYITTDSRAANTVLAAPNGASGAATFRALVAADIPTLTKSKISDFPTTWDWSNITNKPTTWAWTAITGKPTTIAGYGITDAKIVDGVITLGAVNITPITSVAMTVPSGFSISGSPISKAGTLALSYESGYEGFTTELKNKLNSLFSWFEVDSSGNVKTKDYTENGTIKHRGFYSPSFVSALGQGDDGQSGVGDVTWELLAASATGGRTIHLSYISSALASYLTSNSYIQSSAISDMATKTWVGQQDYLKQASLSNYYTKSEVYTKTEVNALARVKAISASNDGLTFTWQDGATTIADFSHEHSFLELLDRPTTVKGYGIVMTADDIPSLPWGKITSGKPTTIAGYGITDAITTGNIGNQSVSYATTAGTANGVSWGNVGNKPSAAGNGTTPVYWTGSGFTDCTPYSSASVNYANSAGSVAWANVTSHPTKLSQFTNDSGYVTSSGVTSVATGTGLTGGTITSTGTISINSTYQTYISHGESAYNSLGNYLPLAGGDMNSNARISFGGGNGYIGNANNAGWLMVQDICSQNGAGDTYWSLRTNGTAHFTEVISYGGVTALSDARHKTIVRNTNISVEQIAAMRSVVYRWSDRRDNSLHVGSIAQDWQGVLPQVVSVADDKEHTLGLQYGVAALIAVITTARKVVDHEKRITELEKERDAWKEAYSFIKNAYEELKLKIA